MAKFCTLCSGSSGNSAYIACGSFSILIDAGTNTKRLCNALSEIGALPESIGAIFITHEHNDHISALRVFASRYRVPVYATRGTLLQLEKGGHLNGGFDVFEMPSEGAQAGPMLVKSFKTSHDSAQSCGYTVLLPHEQKISVVTDTGYFTDEAASAVKGSDLVLLESNHDETMLKNGPYPYPLKKRILSDKGHLSNDDCAKAAQFLVNNGTTRLVLGHLSRENNTPAAAFRQTDTALGQMGAVRGVDYTLTVAPPGLGEGTVIL